MAENKLESIVVDGIEYKFTIDSSCDILSFISEQPIMSDDEEIDFLNSNDEPVVIIHKDGIKVKSITDMDDYPIGSENNNINSLIIDLPVSDGSDIEIGFAYIESSTGNVKIKL